MNIIVTTIAVAVEAIMNVIDLSPIVFFIAAFSPGLFLMGISIGIALGVSLGIALDVSLGIALGGMVDITLGVSLGVSLGITLGVSLISHHLYKW